MDGLQWKTLLKWMIWGYPYFRKPPNILGIANNHQEITLCHYYVNVITTIFHYKPQVSPGDAQDVSHGC